MIGSSTVVARSLTAALAALFLTVGASAEAATTVRFRATYINSEDDQVLSVLSVDGSSGADRISILKAGKRWTVQDPGGVTVTKGCRKVSRTKASCPRPDRFFVSTDRGDDVVRASVAGPYQTNIAGGAGADDLSGTGDLAGDGGDDVLRGGGGGSLDGGSGNDRLLGDSRGEELTGGAGHDVLSGGAGNDMLDGDAFYHAPEQDDLDGGPGRDVLAWDNREMAVTVDLSGTQPSGAAGEGDTLANMEAARTGSGADTLTGSAGDDTFVPGAGDDTVTTGPGDDMVKEATADEDTSHDQLDLGLGSDTVNWAASTLVVHVDLADPGPDGEAQALDTLVGVENAIGASSADDTVVPVGTGDVLIGDEGPNVLQGSGGPDTISGGGGDDQLYGETRYADTPDDAPGSGIQICLCWPADDTLHGGPGNDVLEGGLDADRLDGGPGDDVLRGDLDPKLHDAAQTKDDVDVADYADRTAPVTAATASGGGEAGEHDTYVGIEGIKGGSGADTLRGRAGHKDVLSAGAGDDLVDTRDGDVDTLDCGTGSDRYRADATDKPKNCETAARRVTARARPG